jgi:hypothetical protein
VKTTASENLVRWDHIGDEITDSRNGEFPLPDIDLLRNVGMD